MNHNKLPQPSRFDTQDALYAFPYHYIPHFIAPGTPLLSRRLEWGFEYLCYTEHIKHWVENLSPRSIIDIGCGDGRLVSDISKSVPRALGVDISEKAISFARSFSPTVEFRVASASSIEEKFDLALAVEVLEHIPDNQIPGFLSSARNLLSTGGRLIVSVPSTNLQLNQKHYRHYTKQLLIEQVLGAAPDLNLDACDYVFFEPWWVACIRKAMRNRYIFIESVALNSFIWSALWDRRVCKETQGHHVIAVFRAPVD